MRRYWAVGAAFVSLAALLAWLGLRPAEIPEMGPVRLTLDQQEDFREIVRLNGHACAKIVEAVRREGETYYLECETHPDRLARRAYTLDLKTRKAR